MRWAAGMSPRRRWSSSGRSRRIAATLRSVEGLETAEAMDREVWFVTGTASGDALVWAAAALFPLIKSSFQPECRAYCLGLADTPRVHPARMTPWLKWAIDLATGEH